MYVAGCRLISLGLIGARVFAKGQIGRFVPRSYSHLLVAVTDIVKRFGEWGCQFSLR